MTFGLLSLTQVLLIVALGVSLCLAGEVRVPQVPRGHPRVYLRPTDIRHLKEKVASPEFQPLWERVQADAEKSAVSAALVYVITGDEAAGRAAIEGALSALRASTDARVFDEPFHWGACVYDWCYDLLTSEEKAAFITEFERIASLHEPWYPARMDTMAVVGHVCEGWLVTGQLPAGLAIYDESPTMYDAAVRLFMEKLVPVRNFHYAAHWHHQGDSYLSRLTHDLAASWLFRRMGAGDVLSREQQFVPYQFIYNLRPDGLQMRSGDTYDESGKSESKRMIAMMAGAYYQDPYLLTMADSELFWSHRAFARALEILFREPGSEKRPISGLPLTKYFPDPGGEMVARTGWRLGKDSPDAVVQMRIGGYFFGNHQHRDFGSFQIYCRGPLAIDSGIYQGENSVYGTEHWGAYYHQTLAHNGLLIFDPDEVGWSYIRPVNDGGQRVPNENRDHPRDLESILTLGYRMGEVSAHAFGPDPQTPDYSYLAGDITKAYTDKARSVTRSMVTLNLRNATYPAALIVYDRVVSSKPEFRKTWLLHSIEEPQVSGRTITIARTEAGYRGKLVAESLLPAQATITKVGGPGKEFWVESVQKNYATTKNPPAEPGAWRVEVSPSVSATSDQFLHVMTVMDASVPNGPEVLMLDGDDLIGARLLDRVVLFSKSGELLTRAAFSLAGPSPTKVLVCDLRPGRWSVTKDGAPLRTLQADGAGRCLYFQAGAGRYALERKP
jgi:heparin/heparan-sulfate lyase